MILLLTIEVHQPHCVHGQHTAVHTGAEPYLDNLGVEVCVVGDEGMFWGDQEGQVVLKSENGGTSVALI